MRDLTIAAIGIIAVTTAPAIVAGQANQPTPNPQPAKGFVIRGCLKGEKLSRIEPQNVEAAVETKLPDVLNVTSIRVIRSQVKALNGHQVEVTGALLGIPGVETGVVVVNSDNGKLIFGGDTDPAVTTRQQPTIRAELIKDLAPTCPVSTK
jgi:hypothetical protein